MINQKALILAQNGLTTELLSGVIEANYNEVDIILEHRSDHSKLLINRAKKIGWLKVIGQITFLILIAPFIKNSKRIEEIIENSGLNVKSKLSSNAYSVKNINESNTIERIKRANANIIYVNGTRILSKKLLSCINIPIINIHVGITPKYRGVHGGFWAIKKNDLENFGVTIHHIDAGVDTGAIIDQLYLVPDSKDNYASYPILQYTAALNRISELIKSDDSFYTKKVIPRSISSQIHYHPTIWEYFF